MREQGVGSASDQARGSGIAPEPIPEFGGRAPARLALGRFEVPGPQVVAAKAKPFMNGFVGLRFWGWGPVGQIAEQLYDSLTFEPARPNRRGSTPLEIEFVPRREALYLFDGRRDEFGMLFGCRMKGDRAGPIRLVLFAGCGFGRIVRKIFKNDWAVIAFQEPQRFRQDSALEVRFVRRSEGAAEFERNPEKTGELHLFRVFTDQAYSGGRDAFGFEVVTCRANGAGAVRSDGDEADRVDLVLPKQTREFTHGGLDLLGQPARAHERVVVVRDRSNQILRFELSQSIDREDEVHVLAKSSAIEVDRGMGHRQVVGCDVARDDPVAQVDQREGFVGRAV